MMSWRFCEAPETSLKHPGQPDYSRRFTEAPLHRDTSTVSAALDVQLRHRLRQGSLHRCDLFRAQIFFHRRFGAGDGGFGRVLVDSRNIDSHVGQDRNGTARDLDEAFADGQKGLLATLE